MTTRAEREHALVVRGRALPEECRFLYLSKPTPFTERWVFQGADRVFINFSEAYEFVLEMEKRHGI